jgi:toxin secretion/phage lysis holin
MTIKSIVCTLSGAVGAVITGLFGGWSAAMTTLMIFMGLDYLTGIAVAGVFKNSSKSESGGLESRAGWKGLIRKGATLAVVLIAYRLDLLLGTLYIKDAVIIAFCVNEVISLTENAGLMGVPIPETIKKAIELLKKKGGDEE